MQCMTSMSSSFSTVKDSAQRSRKAASNKVNAYLLITMASHSGQKVAEKECSVQEWEKVLENGKC